MRRAWRSITPWKPSGHDSMPGRLSIDRHEALVRVFVPAQARQRDHGRQRLPGTCATRQPRAARLDPQARDRLAPIIEDLEQRSVLLRVGLREQPAHANHRCQHLLQRTIGEIPGEAHRLLQPDRQLASRRRGAARPSWRCRRRRARVRRAPARRTRPSNVSSTVNRCRTIG